MEGSYFNIQRFCLDDGPGIRTTIFLKGCPLRCQWCHNPESQAVAPQLLYSPEKCIGCGACAAACPHGCHSLSENGHGFDRTQCQSCGACAAVCCTKALELCGKRISAEDAVKELVKDAVFFEESGGGITFSGGEPLTQAAFVAEVSRALKARGLPVAVETCGFGKEDDVRLLAETTDLFLFDWKVSSEAEHRFYTGADQSVILRNLHLLDALGRAVILRCPIIPDVNLKESHFARIAELAQSLPAIRGIDLLPYHPLGISKLHRLGREADYDRNEFLEAAEVRPWAEWLRDRVDVPVHL